MGARSANFGGFHHYSRGSGGLAKIPREITSPPKHQAAPRAAQPQPRSPSSFSSELRADAEAAGLDPAQWIGGEFVFDWWPSDSLLTGHVERIDDIDE